MELWCVVAKSITFSVNISFEKWPKLCFSKTKHYVWQVPERRHLQNIVRHLLSLTRNLLQLKFLFDSFGLQTLRRTIITDLLFRVRDQIRPSAKSPGNILKTGWRELRGPSWCQISRKRSARTSFPFLAWAKIESCATFCGLDVPTIGKSKVSPHMGHRSEATASGRRVPIFRVTGSCPLRRTRKVAQSRCLHPAHRTEAIFSLASASADARHHIRKWGYGE